MIGAIAAGLLLAPVAAIAAPSSSPAGTTGSTTSTTTPTAAAATSTTAASTATTKTATSTTATSTTKTTTTKTAATAPAARYEVVSGTYSSSARADKHLAAVDAKGIAGLAVHKFKVPAARYRVEERGLTRDAAATTVKALHADHFARLLLPAVVTSSGGATGPPSHPVVDPRNVSAS